MESRPVHILFALHANKAAETKDISAGVGPEILTQSSILTQVLCSLGGMFPPSLSLNISPKGTDLHILMPGFHPRKVGASWVLSETEYKMALTPE